MSENPQNSVFIVTGTDSGVFGTAFVFFKDMKSTYLLTCTHVIEDIGDFKDVRVNGYPVVLVAKDAEEGFDLAVLRVDSVFDVPVLKLDEYKDKKCDVTLTGYYSFGKQCLSQTLEGKLTAQGKVESENRKSRYNCWHLDVTGPFHLEKGYSGAPVIDTYSNKVIGIVNQRRGDGEKGLVISISSLRSICEGENLKLLAALDSPHSSRTIRLQDEPPLINYEREMKIFADVISQKDNQLKVIGITGEGQVGKSRLLREYRLQAERINIHTILMDLKQQMNIEIFLEHIAIHYGLSNFNRFLQFLTVGRPESLTIEKEKEWLCNLTLQFFLDLEMYRQAPLIIVFIDHYERAEPYFKDWLDCSYLPRTLSLGSIITVIAGQESVRIASNPQCQIHFTLKGVSREYFHQYASGRLPSESIDVLFKASNGKAGFIVQYFLFEECGEK